MPFSFLFLIYFSSICFYTVMYKTWGQPQPHVWGRGLLKSVTVHPRDSSGMARKRVLQKCALPHGICDEDCFYLHFLKLFFFLTLNLFKLIYNVCVRNNSSRASCGNTQEAEAGRSRGQPGLQTTKDNNIQKQQ